MVCSKNFFYTINKKSENHMYFKLSKGLSCTEEGMSVGGPGVALTNFTTHFTLCLIFMKIWPIEDILFAFLKLDKLHKLYYIYTHLYIIYIQYIYIYVFIYIMHNSYIYVYLYIYITLYIYIYIYIIYIYIYILYMYYIYIILYIYGLKVEKLINDESNDNLVETVFLRKN